MRLPACPPSFLVAVAALLISSVPISSMAMEPLKVSTNSSGQTSDWWLWFPWGMAALATLTALFLAASIPTPRRRGRRYGARTDEPPRVDAVRRRHRQQQAIAVLGRLALTGASPDKLFDRACRLARLALGADDVAIFVGGMNKKSLLLRAGEGRENGIRQLLELEAGDDSLARYTMLSRSPVVFDDLSTDGRFLGSVLAEVCGVRSGITIVLNDSEGVAGILGALSSDRKAFDNDDATFMLSLGYLVSLALRRNQDERVRETQRLRLEAILENASDALLLCDESGAVEIVNPAAVRLFGCRGAGCAGEHLGDFIQPASGDLDADTDAPPPMDLLTVPGTREGFGIHKDNSTFPIEFDVAVVTQEQRKLLIVTARDRTGRKALEQKRLQSQEMEALTRISGGTAHEFNNLLTVILGDAEILAEDRLPPAKIRALAESIHRAARRAQSLSFRLTAFSRQQCLEPRAFAADDLIDETVALLEPGDRHDIRIRSILAARRPLFADPDQLQSTLLMLAGNAFDAMPDGGEVRIETADADIAVGSELVAAGLSPGRYVAVSVTDTGMGMDEEVRSKAFEPFFTTKGVGAGSGLGLSAVYGFARQSGGLATLHSEPDHGTTVRLYLPSAVQESFAAAGENRGLATLPRGTESVLVVDDDALVREYAVRMISELGYKVQATGDAASALDILRAGQPVDLLFTDVVMPGGMNGRRLSDEAIRLRPGLRVLYTTGYAEDAIERSEHVSRLGQVIRKPYRMADLAPRLRNAICHDAGNAY